MLPAALEVDDHQRMREFEEAEQMPYVTTAERIGIQKGIEQGISRGEARLLRRQLARRFGSLPDWVESRLTEAGAAELEIWGERLLEAPSLEAVFSA